MEPKDLKFYGISQVEASVNLPKKIELKFRMKCMKMVFKNIGFLNFMRFMFSFPAIMKKMQKQDFSKIREKGLNNEKFFKSQVEISAMHSTFVKLLGQEKTTELIKQIEEIVGTDLFPELFPLPDDLMKCKEPFEAFKEWFIAMLDAEKEIGCHYYEIIENSNSAFQINCTYCAWHEIAKLFGSDKADICYADDVFFRNYLKPLELKFVRTTTFFRGGPFCDMRFERE